MSTTLDGVFEAAKLDPLTWEGTYHAYIIGKTGEVLFSLGIIPALRHKLPLATLVWHVATKYQKVIDLVLQDFAPDEVEDHVLLGEDYSEAVRIAVTEGAHALTGISFDKSKQNLCVNLYRTHHWYRNDPDVSHRKLCFYRAFTEAVGLDPTGYYELPEVVQTSVVGTLALVLPTANVHSRLRDLRDVKPGTWKKIATLCETRGLVPLANGYAPDGKLDMPGWKWCEEEGIGFLLDRLSEAAWCVGLNSGAVFAHRILGPEGCATSMLDPQSRSIYDIAYMPELRGNFVQTRWHPSKFDVDGWIWKEAVRVLGSEEK